MQTDIRVPCYEGQVLLCSFAPTFQAGSAGMRADTEGVKSKGRISEISISEMDEKGMERKECIQVNDLQK